MTAVLGFGGVKANAQHVVIDPKLYKKWNALEFNLVYQGDRFSIKITRTDVTIHSNASNKNHRAFMVAGQLVDCVPGKFAVAKY